MTLREVIRRPAALLPVAMSLLAFSAVAVHLARYGPAPQPDEGTAAHIWQILMAAQVPVIALFGAKWLPKAPRPALAVLAFQAAAALVALAPVYLLKW